MPTAVPLRRCVFLFGKGRAPLRLPSFSLAGPRSAGWQVAGTAGRFAFSLCERGEEEACSAGWVRRLRTAATLWEPRGISEGQDLRRTLFLISP